MLVMALEPFDVLSEEELVHAAIHAPEGDVRAFERLVYIHQKRLLENCRHLTRDESNFEDLAQEVLVKAYFGLPKFEGKSSFGHWLKRIKVNHCLNHLKRQEGRTAVDIEEHGIQYDERLQVLPSIEATLDLADTRGRIRKVLNFLPLTLRVPLVMCDMDDMSYDEISQSLGIGLSAAKMRIKRAREEFRRLYDSPPEEVVKDFDGA